MPIKIKKKVSLDFLGEEYASSYVTFVAVPINEYEKLQSDVKGLKEGETVKFITDYLVSRLVEGEIDQDGEKVKITSENFGELTADVYFTSFAELTGQVDPKN